MYVCHKMLTSEYMYVFFELEIFIFENSSSFIS